MIEARHSKMDLADLSTQRVDESSSWAVSYSDLITLLLCFFILFFAIFSQKQAQEMDRKTKEAMTIAEEKIKAASQPKTIGLMAQEINEKFAKLENVYSLVYQLPGIETVKIATIFSLFLAMEISSMPALMISMFLGNIAWPWCWNAYSHTRINFLLRFKGIRTIVQ